MTATVEAPRTDEEIELQVCRVTTPSPVEVYQSQNEASLGNLQGGRLGKWSVTVDSLSCLTYLVV